MVLLCPLSDRTAGGERLCHAVPVENWSLPSTDFSSRSVTFFIAVMASTDFEYSTIFLCGSSACILIVSNCTPRNSRTWAGPSVLWGATGIPPTGCTNWEKIVSLYCSHWSALGQRKNHQVLWLCCRFCCLSIHWIASENCSKMRHEDAQPIGRHLS